MKIEKRNISNLIPNPVNVRRHNKKQIDELKKSINKFDVIRPVVIDENGTILAGHGLYEALTQLGYKEVDVIVKKGLSEKEKKKLLLADNKIYSLGADDYGVIEEILQELGESSDFEIPGYDSDILEELYGIQSLQEELKDQHIQEDGITQISKKNETEKNELALREPEPSERTREERASAQLRRFIICPVCGEKIEV